MDQNKRPIILDCDPGTDDAICLFMLLGDDRFDIKGITPVCGNKPLSFCERNALQLCELTGREDIPVLKGASQSLFCGERTAGNVHGAGGLGSVTLPDPHKQVEDQYAWDFIYQQAVACKGELEIVAIGPLTNVAGALLKYPNLKDYVKRISIMGGAKGLGNWTAAAEFNIWADPHAAKIVFASGIPMAMMGLDICFKAYVTADDLVRIRAAGGPVAEVAAELIGERVGYAEKSGRPGGILCDAVTAAYVMDESVVQTVDVHVDVETRGILTEGKTVITYKHTEDRHFPPNTKMGEDVDRPRFIDLIVNSLTNLNR
ncbi:nucleoside hydrolase [Bittarella massiliensis (ex Durand et al. 2017)]|uniref:nucleoside hydrolase n=1 Tax=Bittarella massiliensis (ex Durand et al. 2017) TaxID=1720313 RepID=UPI001AA107CF|nr:nucleoside hydrolase [Bittarella massiliensis (ex Durand et al. 2017)]MBO1679116.1 nucleoside hydrolase [Bittarella massiliensis (ex Durand et al. 2017)]